MSGNNGAPRNDSHELLIHLRNFKDMIVGGMNNENGPARLETDPQGLIQDLAEYIEFAKQDVLGLRPTDNWREKLGGEVIDAEQLAPYIDMQLPWLIEPVLCRGFLTQIQGEPKGGKSAFSLWLSSLAATGDWNRISALDRTPAEPKKVLYLAWEDPKIMMAKRLSLYAVGMGYERTFLPKNLRFLFAPTFFANREDHIAALSDAIKEYGADIVVIDTLSHSHECEENSADQMRIPMANLNRMANDLNIAMLYIHHTSKAKDKSPWERGRGSGAIAAAWHILIDWGQREEGSDVNPVRIKSKLGVDGSWNINYGKQFDNPNDPKELTGVVWSIDTGEQVNIDGILNGSASKRKGDRSKDKVMDCLKSLLITTPEGVPGKTLVSILGQQGLGKSIVYRYLGEFEETGVASKTIKGNATIYKLTGV